MQQQGGRVIDPSDPMVQAMLQEQQVKQRQAAIDSFCLNTAAQIYSRIVAGKYVTPDDKPPFEDLRQYAADAKSAALALAEAFGMVTLETKPQIQHGG